MDSMTSRVTWSGELFVASSGEVIMDLSGIPVVESPSTKAPKLSNFPLN